LLSVVVEVVEVVEEPSSLLLQEITVKLKQKISKMCIIFFIFSSMPKVKFYCQFEIMRIRVPFIFYLSRMKVYVVEEICNRIDCCRIIDNICVYYLTVKN